MVYGEDHFAITFFRVESVRREIIPYDPAQGPYDTILLQSLKCETVNFERSSTISVTTSSKLPLQYTL
jgi:hypothetical protein